MDQDVGKIIDGRYKLEELLGIGGMASVYKARDIQTDEPVAVKILRDEYMTNTAFRRRFKNESKAMAVLSHSNIRALLDVCFSEEQYAIIMEYLDGITLKEYIQEKHVISPMEALHFTKQILDALQFAHERGIIHRDVKPQNLMLLSDGTIKITDFGIARFARSEIQTITEQAIGSVYYISPEQAAGESADARTDIYSTGVILYEMLTGKVPFDAEAPVSVALKHINDEAELPCSINPDIPKNVQALTIHAMEKDRQKRYRSAAEMLRDIKAVQANPEADIVCDDSKLEEAGKQEIKKNGDVKRKWTNAPSFFYAMVGITVSVMLVTVGFISWMLNESRLFERTEVVNVPDLLGLTFDEIKNVPEYAKLQISMIGTERSELGERGEICQQSPIAGTSMKTSQTIEVIISEGAPAANLPNFSGKNAHEAEEWAIKRQVTYKSAQSYDSSTPEGSVIKTEPMEGTKLEPGDTLVAYISKGPNDSKVQMPDLKGLSEEDAQLLLTRSGLKTGMIFYDENNATPEIRGIVTNQSEKVGAVIMAETEVDLVVAGKAESGTSECVRQLMVPLPRNIDHFVRLRAVMDSRYVWISGGIPSQLKTWRPNFTNRKDQVSEISIFIEDELYQVYQMDFNSGVPKLLRDYSADFYAITSSNGENGKK